VQAKPLGEKGSIRPGLFKSMRWREDKNKNHSLVSGKGEERHKNRESL